jgi:myo-inositol 2-dehydrogenase / D-chiro-inositol 1-dehydrogenase
MGVPLRVAIAGCGRISERGHVPALCHVPEARLCALADPDRGRRDRLALSASGNPRTFESVLEMVEATAPDVVVVASPPEFHLEHARIATEAGAHVLVEKPPGRGRDDAERLTRLGRPVWVGFNRRFSHLPALAGRIPAEGELRLALRISYRRASWRAHEVRDDALADLGPHLADLAGCLLGGDLTAARAREIGPRRARVDLVGPRGTAGVVCETDTPWSERMEVRDGDDGLLARSVHGGPMRGAAARLRRREHPLVDSLVRQLRALAGAAAGDGDGALATGRDGVRAMSALEAARRSAARGGALVPL